MNEKSVPVPEFPRLLDFEALAAEYAVDHADRRNRLCHAVGIPLIMLAVAGWTQVAPGVPWVAAVLPLYWRWDRRLAVMMAVVLAAMTGVAAYLPGWTLIAAFVVGWVFQLVGHQAFEGRSPAFTKNLVQVLVGPMFILRELVRGEL